MKENFSYSWILACIVLDNLGPFRSISTQNIKANKNLKAQIAQLEVLVCKNMMFYTKKSWAMVWKEGIGQDWRPQGCPFFIFTVH
jgi:hypothetical protein